MNPQPDRHVPDQHVPDSHRPDQHRPDEHGPAQTGRLNRPDSPTDRPEPSLTELAVRLEAMAAGWEADATNGPLSVVVGVKHGPYPAFDLRVPPDAERSVVDALVGFQAPAHWRAVGIVANGSAWRFGPLSTDEAPTVGRRRQQVRVVHLCDRSAVAVTRISGQGRAGADTTLDLGRPQSGRMIDVCRRALGLATSPTSHPTEHLWEGLWLDRIALLALDREGRPRDWSAIAACHPAAQHRPGDPPPAIGLWTTGTSTPPTPTPAELRRAGSQLAAAFSWEDLRRAAAYGRWRTPTISPNEADWMDAGMFSRWLCDGRRAIDDLAGELEHDGLLSPRLMAAIRLARNPTVAADD